MNKQTFVKDYLSFSKKERTAIITLLIGIVIIIVLPFIKSKAKGGEKSGTDTAWLATAEALLKKNAYESDQGEKNDINDYQYDLPANTHSVTKNEVFLFDPNTLNAGGFKKLGLREKTIQTLMNYRNKGGRFRKPDDLKKIYGLRQEEFERLKPFISIGENIYSNQQAVSNTDHQTGNASQVSESAATHKLKIIEINSADAAAYESLYGIGPKLALRIISFRDKLGGFYSIDQVGETYGVSDSTFQKIKSRLQANANMIRKININTASYEELNNHPYINSKSAFQILKYRKEKGNFSIIEEIRNLLQPNDSFEKIIPYIKAE